MSIRNFLIDGKYDNVGKIYPCCKFPNGHEFRRQSTISSVFDCTGTNFLLKNVETFSLSEGTDYFGQVSYYNTGSIISSTNNKCSQSGCYKINNNILQACTTGYSYSLGEVQKFKTVITKTDTGYVQNYYYKKDGNWILLIDIVQTRIS